MSIDLIKAIKDAEEKADQIIKQSLTDARQMVADAENQSVILVEQAMEQAFIKANDIITNAEKSAVEEISQIKEEITHECNLLRKQASNKIEAAVNLICGRIVNY